MQLARRENATGAGRFVVVEKLLADKADEVEQKRFTRQARAGTLFEHPALVKTLELGKLKDGMFCIRGFLQGDSLGFLAALAGEAVHTIEPMLAAELVAQAAEGLHFVHTLRGSGQEQLGLVHQNIHPDNLVLTASGRLKLVNFSLTRKVQPVDPSRQTAYLSPEQCMIQEVDARSDVFSLGVVLWELLCGRRLFERQSDDATRKAVIACLVSPVGTVARSIPEDLAGICDRALARKPEGRFASAGEMADALRGLTGVGSVGEGAKLAGSFVRKVAGDRMQAKRAALDKIEFSVDAPVDPELLLPATTANAAAAAAREPAEQRVSTLPPRPAPPEADDKPESEDPSPPPVVAPPPRETARQAQVTVEEEPKRPAAPAEPKPEEVLEMAAPEPAAPPPGLDLPPEPDATEEQDEPQKKPPAEPVTRRAIAPPSTDDPEPSGDQEDVEDLEPLFEEDAAEVSGASIRRPSVTEETEEPAVAEPVTAPRMRTCPPGEPQAATKDATPGEPPPLAESPPDQPAGPDLPTRIRMFYDRNRLPCLVGGGLLFVLILIAAWPSDDEESGDQPGDKAGVSTGAEDAPRSPEEVLAELEREQAEAAARRPAKPELANIRVMSDPAGCQVWLDGRALAGRTPLENVFVPAGLDYEITVACKGHEKQKRRVLAGAGQPVAVEFYPPPAGASDRHFGRLQLTTRPRVWVYLGKKKLGMTPLLGVRLPAGKHQLRLVNKPRRIRRKLEVVIQPDQTTTLQETF